MKLHQKGQALLIVLLSMAVILTVVLSILSRSVTDIAQTSRSEESIRAFSAAEAGVEQALIRASTSGQFEGATYDASVDDIGEGLTEFAYPADVASNDTATIWLVSHDTGGGLVCNATNPCFTGSQIRICWGKSMAYSNPSLMPAIETTVLYLATPGNKATARLARGTYDANAGRTATNRFDAASAAGCSIDGKTFQFSANLNFATLGIPAAVYNTANGLQVVSVRLLYNSDQAHPFGTSSSGVFFPSQGEAIESTGKSGEATRKVRVMRLFSDLPPIFQAAIFASSSVTK